MLATLIQRYDRKSFHFKNKRLIEILQTVRYHIYDCINTICQFIKPVLDIKMSIFEEYRAFNSLFKIKKNKNIFFFQVLQLVECGQIIE